MTQIFMSHITSWYCTKKSVAAILQEDSSILSFSSTRTHRHCKNSLVFFTSIAIHYCWIEVLKQASLTFVDGMLFTKKSKLIQFTCQYFPTINLYNYWHSSSTINLLSNCKQQHFNAKDYKCKLAFFLQHLNTA